MVVPKADVFFQRFEMGFEDLGVKEIDSETLKQETCQHFEEVYRLQLMLKRLEQKISKLKKKSDESVDIYIDILPKLNDIIDSKIKCALGNANPDFSSNETQYQLIDNSKLKIGDEVIELSDDETEEDQSASYTADCMLVEIENIEARQLCENIYIPAEVFEKLYMHQKKGVKWLASLYSRNHGGILADDMGLGKTITILSFFSALIFSIDVGKLYIPNVLEILIVCPITLINQWKDELAKWVPQLETTIFHSSFGALNKDKILEGSAKRKHSVLITSYETLRVNIDSFNVRHWSYVVLDEGQKIRNPDSAITLAVKTLGTPHRLLLSGSPIQNNLVEFWSLLDFVAPGHLGTLPLFVEQFVDPIINSSSNFNTSLAYSCALKLRSLALPFIQRNVKSDFARTIKLPKKTEHVLICNLTSVQYYTYLSMLQSVLNTSSSEPFGILSALNSFKDKFSLGFKANKILLLLTMLRKICNHPDLVLKEPPKDYGNAERSSKLMITLEIISRWEAEGHKILVFSQTIQMLNIIYDNLKKMFPMERIGRIDGEITLKKRSKVLEKFQLSEDVFILLLTTRVGGVGLNLTCADRILIFDPDWNPMTDSQARERCYRIGQNRDVVIYRLISAHTVEEKIYHRQIYKFFLSERILTDPRVVNFRFIPTSDLLQVPPKPPEKKDVPKSYLENMQRQLRSMDFELELRKISNSKELYQNRDDICKNKANADNSDNPLLQSIFLNHGIEGVIKHDDIENSKLSIANSSSSDVADNAIKLMKRSLKERNAYDISVPTWTGKSGRAAAPIDIKRRFMPNCLPMDSRDVLNNLKNIKQNANASEFLFQEDKIADSILNYFRRMPGYSSPTGEVIHHFGPLIPDSKANMFKLILKKLCQLIKVDVGPNYWKLKSEFH